MPALRAANSQDSWQLTAFAEQGAPRSLQREWVAPWVVPRTQEKNPRPVTPSSSIRRFRPGTLILAAGAAARRKSHLASRLPAITANAGLAKSSGIATGFSVVRLFAVRRAIWRKIFIAIVLLVRMEAKPRWTRGKSSLIGSDTIPGNAQAVTERGARRMPSSAAT